MGGRKLRRSWLPSGVRALSVTFRFSSEGRGGGQVRGPAGEPGRNGVGGEGFDCTERSDKAAEKGGGDRKASLSPQVTCSDSNLPAGRLESLMALKRAMVGAMVGACQWWSFI